MIITNAANKSGKRSDNLNQKIHKMKSYKGESIFGLSDWINEIILLHCKQICIVEKLTGLPLKPQYHSYLPEKGLFFNLLTYSKK